MKHWKTLPFVLIQIIAECFLFISVEACSYEGETEQGNGLQKVFDHSDVVIYGHVRYRHPPVLKGDDYYTATMNVFCTLKGPNQGRLVNISDAGLIGGRCFEVVLEVSVHYIVFLTGRSLKPVAEPRKATPEVLSEIASMCTYTGGSLDPAIEAPITGCPIKENNPECPTTREDNTTEYPPKIIADESNHIPYDHSNDVDNKNTIDEEEKTPRVAAASHSSGSSAVKLTTLSLLIPFTLKLWIGYS